MNVLVKKASITDVKADLVIVNLFEGVKIPEGATGAMDKYLGGLISDFVIKKEKFDAKFGKTYLLPVNDANFSKVLIVGLGKSKDFSLNKVRELSSKVMQKCKCISNVKKVASILHGVGIAGLDAADCAQVITEGALIGAYSFDKYKTEKKDESKVKEFTIVENNDANFKKAQKGLAKGKSIVDGINFARDLANEPAMVATPTKIAEEALAIKGVETKVYEKDEIEKMGMNAFLAVSQGSVEPPKFIHMKYSSKKPKKKVALIGKSVTFDSGGLNLKPPSGMLTMKDDMAASASVLGIMKAVVELKPDIELNVIIASCENMPSGHAYRPGDVLTTKNGQTIEVDNTDAEGRITLADALAYAEELKVDEIIDMATLTGACVVALGSAASAIMGNNQKMVDKIIKSGEANGERLWQLPIYDEYTEALKSDIADMRNTGSRWGGASIAGAFLKKFVSDKTPWVHIDIAGTALLDKSVKEMPKGTTGVCVRTITNYLLS